MKSARDCWVSGRLLFHSCLDGTPPLRWRGITGLRVHRGLHMKRLAFTLGSDFGVFGVVSTAAAPRAGAVDKVTLVPVRTTAGC